MTRRVGRHARMIVGGLSVLAMLTSVAGCGLLGGKEADAPATSAAADGKVEKPSINLGVLNVLDVASVHVALKKGYFKDEGLDVKLTVLDTGAASIPALVKGDLDFSFGNWVSFFSAEAKDALKDVGGFKLVSDGYQAKPEMFLLLGKKDGPVKGPKDLAGKTIGINAKRNIAELTAKATLEANNVDPNGVTFKEMKFGDMQAAVDNGSVDAAFMVEPFITSAQRSAGQVTVMDAASGPTDNIPIAGYTTSGKFAKENPKTVAAFQRAMAKGQKDAADRSIVEPLLQDYAKVDKETASLVHFGEYPTSLDATRLQRVATLMKTYGLLDKELDVKPLIIATPGS
ncbi:ABC transporter substrate-binding protein [Umezawaea tangerina]|uniref:NitT/TauT family transport system substrate-binding protein n=1 Tax=Umezawaea tangerina TaxID=84725 RepID=A0A2T0SK02_9PSEU|nr:ABC transporter substrate-binding protein [Umezawaea tangerina]PRY33725.1 NitT/TauT family transport system substrate-binding protein [Umezawaea tangerina]